MQIREFTRWAEAQGWSVRVRNGGHLELTHPMAERLIITSATPSDRRWIANVRAEMRRALPPPPKPVRTSRPRVNRAPKPAPPSIAPTWRNGPPQVEERPQQRLAGGPAGYRSIWSTWW